MKTKQLILITLTFLSWTVLRSFAAEPTSSITNGYECHSFQIVSQNSHDLCQLDNGEGEPRGSRLSPSVRKKDHWEVVNVEAEDEINTKEREEKDYSSTIKKIKEVEIKNNVEVKKSWIQKISQNDHLEIFISGGGYSGGINPVLNDRIMISNSNLLQKLYETENGGVQRSNKKVDREELTELIKWIAEKGFFSFESEYTCENSDNECQSRLNQRPKPIPLKIVVAAGQYRNVVSVPIFAPDINQEEYINYPDELKKIVEAIYVFASL